MPRSLQSRPRCQPFDSSRAERRPGAPTTRRPKPSSLRHHASSLPSGDHVNDRCGDQAGSACSRVSVNTGAASLPSVSAVHSTCQPLASRDVREVITGGREPRLSRRHALAARDDGHWRSPRRDRGSRCATRPTAASGRSHSCHASKRPSGDHAQIPRVVRVRDPHRPGAAVERHHGDVTRVVALEVERHLAPRRHRRTRGATVAGQRPEYAAGGADHDAAGRRRWPRRSRLHPPSTSRRPRRCRRSRPPAAPSRPPARRRGQQRPSKASSQPNRPPSGDQRGSDTERDREIIAGVRRPSVTAPDATRTRSRRAVLRAACLRDPPASILVTSCRLPRLSCRAPATPSVSRS